MDKAEEVFERLLEQKIRPNSRGYAILPKPDLRNFNHVIMTNNISVGPSANKILSKLQDEMDLVMS